MLNFELTTQNLYTREKLLELDSIFLSYLKFYDKSLHESLIAARQDNTNHNNTSYIIELSYVVEDFISQLFHIEDEVILQQNIHKEFIEIYKCKRSFVQRYALKKYPNINDLNIEEITDKICKIFSLPIQEKEFSQKVLLWFEDQDQHATNLDITAQYAAYMVHSQAKNTILFSIPSKIDFLQLNTCHQKKYS